MNSLRLYLRPLVQRGQLLRVTMYALIVSTFFNQSVLSIHIGFFSLFLYRLLLMAAVLIFIYQMFKDSHFLEGSNLIYVKEVLLFLLCWLAYGMISLLWAASLIEGVKYLFLLGMGIVFVYLATFVFTEVKPLLTFFKIWLVMTIVLLIIGFVNHFGSIQLPSSTLYGGPKYKMSYPTSVFTNQNDFAAFLSISFSFYLVFAKNSKSLPVKIATIILAVLSLYTIYLTESRASLLGVLLGLFVYLLILLPKKAKKSAGVSAAVVFLLCIALFGSRLLNKFQVMGITALQDPGIENPSSNVVRLRLLFNTIHYVTETYGFGVGAGNIPYYLQYEPVYNIHHVYEAHNWLGEIMGNFGILIMLLYLAMYVYLFLNLYRCYQAQKNLEYNLLLEGCMIALIAFFISSVSPSSVSNLYFHWVFMGLVIATVSVINKQVAGQKYVHHLPEKKLVEEGVPYVRH